MAVEILRKVGKRHRIKQSLNASVKEGVFSVSSGNVALNYITPYALYLGATSREIGLLSVVQSLAATIAQIPGAGIVEKFSRKTIWYSTYIISRLLWIPVVLLVLFPAYRIIGLIALMFIFAFLNGLRYPAWTSLMADIVPGRHRGQYFGRRNMITGSVTLFAILVSGWVLQSFGFPTLFLLAAFIGLIGVYFFKQIYEPVLRPKFHYKHSLNLSPTEWANTLKMHSNLVWFTIYMIIVSFSVAIAGPFYAVFMLKNLEIGYIWYAIIITINALVAILSQPYWGKFSDRYGDRSVLMITGIMIVIIPLLWTFANSIWFLIIIHIYDGFLFGGWSLVVFNFLIALTPHSKRTSYVANHTFFVGLSTVGGILFASLLVEHFEATPLFGFQGLAALFFLSFIFRLSSLALLPRVHGSYIATKPEPLSHLAWRALVVEPTKGISSFLGHLYDVKWMHEGISRHAKAGWRTLLWKLRWYKSIIMHRLWKFEGSLASKK